MQDKHKKWLNAAVLLLAAAWVAKPYLIKDNAKADKPKAAVAKVDNSRLLGSIRFTPCTLAKGTESLMAYCGTLQVPENHDAPDGRKITLAISWLPASGDAEPDPIFMLAGGPGQAARGSFPMVAGAFAEARKKRHIILLDQRGTGDSSPLKCVNEKGESSVVDDEDYSADAAVNFAKRCAAQYAGKVDVAQFSSSDAVRDLDAARKAIGAEKINLIGISYGTRMAQLYGKRYPQHIRTITIDGIAPLETVLGQEHAKNLESSLDLQFAQCSKDKACREKLGDPRAQLNTLLATLAKGPVPVHYRDAITGEWKDGQFSSGHLAMLTRLLAYQPQAASRPSGNHRGCSALMSLPETTGRASPGFSSGQRHTDAVSHDMLGWSHWNQASCPSWTRGPP